MPQKTASGTSSGLRRGIIIGFPCRRVNPGFPAAARGFAAEKGRIYSCHASFRAADGRAEEGGPAGILPGGRRNIANFMRPSSGASAKKPGFRRYNPVKRI